MARPKKTMTPPESAGGEAQSSGGTKEVEITSLDQLAVYEKEGTLVGWTGFGEDGKGIAKVLASFLLMFSVLFAQPAFAAVDPTDEAVLGNNRWSVQSDGDLVPATDESFDIGASTSEVDNLYVKTAIFLNGSSYTSFAAGTDGNWTDNGPDITLDRAPTKFIATVASGDFFATGFTLGAGDITFANGGKLDGDTANEIRLIENSDTLKIGFSGDDITVDSTDGGVIFALTDATDGTVDFQTNNDTDDYIQISTATNQPLINFVGSNGKITAASGTIDFDNEILTTTGTLSAGATTVTSLIIGDETFSVPTDDTIRIASNDAQTIWDVYTPGTADEDAVLRLSADASADNGDDWQAVSDGATNSLLLQNDTSGSQATILTLAGTGLITTTGDITVAGTTPLVTIGDGGDEDAGVQINSDTNDFYIASENGADDLVVGLGSAIGTTPIWTTTDTGVTEIRGSTDGDLTVYGAGATASDAYLRLVGDAGADAADRWQFFNDSSAGALIIQNDTSIAGTYVTKITIDSAGLVTTTGDVAVEGTTPLVTIGDGGDEDTGIQINSDTNDFYIASENGADDLVIGLGSVIGTTPILSMTDVGYTTVTGSTDGILTVWGAGTTASDAYLRLVGDAQADASDSLQLFYDSSAGSLFFGIDDTTPGTYVDKMAIDSTGDFYVYGSEATAGSINIWADNGDDAADKFSISMDAANLLTMTTGATEAATVSTAGLWTLPAATVTGAVLANGAVTLGNAIGDITTFTGKIARASPMSFDGTTADTVYTIFAMDDPTTASKTITFPAVTGQVMLGSASTALTAGAAVTLTIGDGNQTYTDTITTDNQDQTITFSGAGTVGDQITIIFTTDSGGVGDEVITFETTLTQSAGTLTLANLTAGQYVVSFISNGSVWIETSRTAALS